MQCEIQNRKCLKTKGWRRYLVVRRMNWWRCFRYYVKGELLLGYRNLWDGDELYIGWGMGDEECTENSGAKRPIVRPGRRRWILWQWFVRWIKVCSLAGCGVRGVEASTSAIREVLSVNDYEFFSLFWENAENVYFSDKVELTDEMLSSECQQYSCFLNTLD